MWSISHIVAHIHLQLSNHERNSFSFYLQRCPVSGAGTQASQASGGCAARVAAALRGEVSAEPSLSAVNRRKQQCEPSACSSGYTGVCSALRFYRNFNAIIHDFIGSFFVIAILTRMGVCLCVVSDSGDETGADRRRTSSAIKRSTQAFSSTSRPMKI